MQPRKSQCRGRQPLLKWLTCARFGATTWSVLSRQPQWCINLGQREKKMPQIFFLSVGPHWVFSSRTGKICNFKRLRFYICFMPYVLLNQTPQLLPQNRRNDRGKSVEGLFFQASLCFARERHLVASQHPAIATAQNRGKNRPWEQNLPPSPRPWRKRVEETAGVAGTADYCEEPGRHLYSLPVDHQDELQTCFLP